MDVPTSQIFRFEATCPLGRPSELFGVYGLALRPQGVSGLHTVIDPGARCLLVVRFG